MVPEETAGSSILLKISNLGSVRPAAELQQKTKVLRLHLAW